jgi:hypothetical protein
MCVRYVGMEQKKPLIKGFPGRISKQQLSKKALGSCWFQTIFVRVDCKLGLYRAFEAYRCFEINKSSLG